MKYDKLQEHFKNEDGMNELLTECQEVFDGIDKLNDKLMEGMLNNPDAVSLALQESTGYFGFLSPITKVAEGVKKNEEGRYYVKRKSQYEKDEVTVTTKDKKNQEVTKTLKFTDASCKREAEVYAIIYRNVRNILQGYLASADAIKGACQSIRKDFENESQ